MSDAFATTGQAIKPRLIVIGPLPPPLHGVTVSTSLVVANPHLQEHFDMTHVDTSDHRDGTNVGRWDVTNVLIGLRNMATLFRFTGKTDPGVLYLPISQSGGAILRDSLFIRIAAIANWRIAIHLRGSEILPFYASRNRLFRRWIRASLKRVSSAAVMGESLRGAFGDLVPPDRIVVVPNGTPSVGSVGARDRHCVLFLSNLRRRKGVVEAVEAARLTLERAPCARFVFTGAWEDDQLESEVRQRAASANDRIDFRTPVAGAAKDELLGTSGILLFPPRAPEGHPRVILEGMAAGLPVVATDRGAISETIRDGITGFVLPEPNPTELAERLVRLLSDDVLYDRMSRAALSEYESRFTQTIADKRLADWLVQVAASQDTP